MSAQPSAWRVRCYDSKGKLHSDVTRYEPVPAYELANLEHHFAVHVLELFEASPHDVVEALREAIEIMGENGIDDCDAYRDGSDLLKKMGIAA